MKTYIILAVMGISIKQFNGPAIALIIIAFMSMAIAIGFIWIRVRELSDESKGLSKGVHNLNTKVQDLEKIMKPDKRFKK